MKKERDYIYDAFVARLMYTVENSSCLLEAMKHADVEACEEREAITSINQWRRDQLLYTAAAVGAY